MGFEQTGVVESFPADFTGYILLLQDKHNSRLFIRKRTHGSYCMSMKYCQTSMSVECAHCMKMDKTSATYGNKKLLMTQYVFFFKDYEKACV